ERVVDQVDAVERADVDAELAARAEVPVHDGFRDVLRLDLLDEDPRVVLDAGDRAVPGADRAVDAAIGVDDEFLVLVARDRVGRALDLADPAADARLGDEMRHNVLSIRNLPQSARFARRRAPPSKEGTFAHGFRWKYSEGEAMRELRAVVIGLFVVV